MAITVSLGRSNHEKITVDQEVYTALFDSSVVNSLASYRNSIRDQTIAFNLFVELARKAEIPYSLFFAPKSHVKAQLRRKNDILLAGASKNTFSINSRGSVELRDIELIIKDILRKQTLLKAHTSDPDNDFVGLLNRSRLSVIDQAEKVRAALGINLSQIQTLNKEKTFEYLASLLGSKNIFVSQSSRGHMPQNIQNHVKFSGICIKDKKYPFIFLNNKEEDASFEPLGRKVLTLILLLVCITKSKFAPIAFTEQSRDLIEDNEYLIAEEILMPEGEVRLLAIDSLDDVVKYADLYSVTPSACLMRLRRIGVVSQEDATEYHDTLKDAFANRPQNEFWQPPLETTAFRKYNGSAYAQKIFELIDSHQITRSEARKVLLQNRASVAFLDEFRSKL